MKVDERSALDALFEQVKETLAGKKLTRSGYSESAKVYLLVAAGSEARALHDLFTAIGKFGRTLKYDFPGDKEEEKRKIIKALEQFLATVRM